VVGLLLVGISDSVARASPSFNPARYFVLTVPPTTSIAASLQEVLQEPVIKPKPGEHYYFISLVPGADPVIKEIP